MNTGDITVPKPASDIAVEREGAWYPYGLQGKSDVPAGGLKNPNELISRQFAVLWEIISPVGHILYVYPMPSLSFGPVVNAILDMVAPKSRGMISNGCAFK